ncbi:MAG: phage tail protein [Novosphingobium sp.]
MLMALDMFIFEIGTLPYQELRQKFEWRFGESERFRARPASQFLGVGAETVELAGALYPGDGIGAYSSIDTIRDMAGRGEAYTMTAGTGLVLGEFTIRSMDVGQSLFFVDGAPRKSDFNLSLARVDG